MGWSVYVGDDERAPGRLHGEKLDLERSRRARTERHRADVDVVTLNEGEAAHARLADNRFVAVNVHLRFDAWRCVGQKPRLLQDDYVESAVTYDVMQVGGFVHGERTFNEPNCRQLMSTRSP